MEANSYLLEKARKKSHRPYMIETHICFIIIIQLLGTLLQAIIDVWFLNLSPTQPKPVTMCSNIDLKHVVFCKQC